MGTGLFASLPGIPVIVRHKVFVSYHHGGDQAYYNRFSQLFHDTYDVIYDNSLVRNIDSDNVDYVIQRIRDGYITGTSCTVVLVGAHTWGRKYVDWEIKATLDKEHALIGVCLPTALPNPVDGNIAVPGRLHDNIQSGFASWLSWQELTGGGPAQLERHIAAAKSRDMRLIDNTRERRVRNA
jgi:hypothetical protein